MRWLPLLSLLWLVSACRTSMAEIFVEVVNDTTFVFDTTLVHDTTIVDSIVIDTIIDTIIQVRIENDTLRFARDSAVWEFDPVVILDYDPTRAELGTFVPADWTPELGMQFWVEVSLSGLSQKDEAFALGIVDGDTLWVGEECPVILDRQDLGRDFRYAGEVDELVGRIDLPLVIQHAIEFDCYVPNNEFKSANSVHAFAVRARFWRLMGL